MITHTVLVEINCKPGQGPAFLAAMLPMLVDTRAFEGCELVETYTDQDNPDTIILWERWTQRSNQEAYLSWRTETGTMADMSHFWTQDPRFVQLSPCE